MCITFGLFHVNLLTKLFSNFVQCIHKLLQIFLRLVHLASWVKAEFTAIIVQPFFELKFVLIVTCKQVCSVQAATTVRKQA